MIRFRLSHQASTDLEGIWDHIGIVKSSPVAASKQVEAIYETLTLLGTQPLIGEARDDLRRGLRSFSVGSYVILYYPLREGVEVAGIVHGAQDIEGMFRSGER
jgi:toxin ParE1/3/4